MPSRISFFFDDVYYAFVFSISTSLSLIEMKYSMNERFFFIVWLSLLNEIAGFVDTFICSKTKPAHFLESECVCAHTNDA